MEISVSVAREDAAVAEFTLEQHGALSVTLEDAEDHPVLEPVHGTMPLWPLVRVRGLFAPGMDRRQLVESLRTVTGVERPDQLRWRDVADRDWERAWMDRFAPMKFGKRLWIVPGGMTIPYDPENIEIHLDPGLAFGTGTHPTTALCLEWLDARALASASVVDYGCGSGVLGIAAALKGATQVLCVDNDPQALEATAANAERNGVADVVECRAPAGSRDWSADIVVANILAGPLIELAPVLLGLLREGGSLALSGILSEQAEDVIAAYRPELAAISVRGREEWILVQGRRVASPVAGAAE